MWHFRVGSGAARTVVAAVLVLAVVACSQHGDTEDKDPSGPASAPTRAGLARGLTRIADTEANRNDVSYDDTAALIKLTGGDPTKGFGLLTAYGAESIGSVGMVPLRNDTGVDLMGETYAISAGQPPAALTVVAGGQDAKVVTKRLTGLGWKSADGVLTAPSVTAKYGIQLQKVKANGGDLIVGQQAAKLDQAGDPSGPTLADNPVMAALAGCLGDVVFAYFITGKSLGSGSMTQMAVGVARPASGSATPKAVSCSAWSSAAAATKYRSAVRTALTSGTSTAARRPYSSYLKNPTVTSVGGRQNVVRWQADTPGRASMIMQMVQQLDLPGLH